MNPPDFLRAMAQLAEGLWVTEDPDRMDARLVAFLQGHQLSLARAANERLPFGARLRDHVLFVVVRTTSQSQQEEVVEISFPPRSTIKSKRMLKQLGADDRNRRRMVVLFIADDEAYWTASSLAPETIISGHHLLNASEGTFRSAAPSGLRESAFGSRQARRRAGGGW